MLILAILSVIVLMGCDELKTEQNEEKENITIEEEAVIEEPEQVNLTEEQEEYPEKSNYQEETITTPVDKIFDLGDYPTMFMKYGKFEGIVVVGKDGSASDVVASTHVINGLSGAGGAVLDYEVSDITAQKIISIGNACNNKVTAKIMGNPANCKAGLGEGYGMIVFYNIGDKAALVITGYDDIDIRRAAKVLGEEPSRLSGSKACVYGDKLTVTKITNCE